MEVLELAKDKAQQVWKFTTSQILLLTEQARHHAAELAPFQQYQAKAQNELLHSFRPELNIPEGLPLTVDLNSLQFLERIEEIPAPTGPVAVLDPGKTPKSHKKKATKKKD